MDMTASRNDIEVAISAAQGRAAHALAGWSQDALVDASRVTKQAIRAALEAPAVAFTNADALNVRLRRKPTA